MRNYPEPLTRTLCSFKTRHLHISVSLLLLAKANNSLRKKSFLCQLRHINAKITMKLVYSLRCKWDLLLWYKTHNIIILSLQKQFSWTTAFVFALNVQIYIANGEPYLFKPYLVLIQTWLCKHRFLCFYCCVVTLSDTIKNEIHWYYCYFY